MSEPAADEDPIHLAAMEWFNALEDPEVSLEDTLAWQEWMAADARHARAFERIEELSQMLRQVRAPARQRPWALTMDRYDASVPLSQWQPRTHRPAWALAASVALGLVVGGWFFWSGSSTGMLTSAVGENRIVSLPDGSKVTLGGDTRLGMTFNRRSRSLELKQGEAFFTVARDPQRPFRVEAGDTAVVALGTSFNVRRASDRVMVTVTEGRVAVEGPETVRLHAGEQTTVAGADIAAPARVDDTAATLAWQSGRLAFRLQPLRYVIEDVNRYAAKPIVIEDADIGALTLTGTVATKEIAEWLGSLERGFGLQAVESPDRIVLRRR